MNKLVIFDFTANEAESRLTNHLTWIHFGKWVGNENIHSCTMIGKDFERDAGFNLVQQCSSICMANDDKISFAIVCEYPSANILEWYESLLNCWTLERVRLFIRETSTMSILPLNYKYVTHELDANHILDQPDYVGTSLANYGKVKLNTFNEYCLEIPRNLVIKLDSPEQQDRVMEVLEGVDKLLLVNFNYTFVNSGDIVDDK